MRAISSRRGEGETRGLWNPARPKVPEGTTRTGLRAPQQAQMSHDHWAIFQHPNLRTFAHSWDKRGTLAISEREPRLHGAE